MSKVGSESERVGETEDEKKMGGGSSECSSSGEEDGYAEWKSAIDSVAATSTFVSSSAAKPPVSSADGDASDQKHKTQQLKHYQIKVHHAYSPPFFLFSTFSFFLFLQLQLLDSLEYYLASLFQFRNLRNGKHL